MRGNLDFFLRRQSQESVGQAIRETSHDLAEDFA
jgi:hypothetical protein